MQPRKYPRLYLNQEQNIKFKKCIHDYFKSIVEIPRMKVGSKQEFETLMNEEALLFTKYWEAKRKTGFPESEL